MYIVGFNGPPRSGKDTLAQMLGDYMDRRGVSIPVHTLPLSYPLRQLAFSLTDLPYSLNAYEDFKVEEFPTFGNRTGRQLMIDISESFLKPLYGQDTLARMFLSRFTPAQMGPCVVLVPDCGFTSEVNSIAAAVGAENFYLARVRREGCDFTNDSRGWVSHTYSADYPNNGTLEDLHTEAGRLYSRLVNQMGWKL